MSAKRIGILTGGGDVPGLNSVIVGLKGQKLLQSLQTPVIFLTLIEVVGLLKKVGNLLLL